MFLFLFFFGHLSYFLVKKNLVLKPSLKTDQYSKFEIDSFSLKFTNKRIEISFTRKKIKSDAKLHKFYLLLFFLSFLSFQSLFDEVENGYTHSNFTLYIFTIFLFVCWICSLSNFWRKNFFLLNRLVIFIYLSLKFKKN